MKVFIATVVVTLVVTLGIAYAEPILKPIQAIDKCYRVLYDDKAGINFDVVIAVNGGVKGEAHLQDTLSFIGKFLGKTKDKMGENTIITGVNKPESWSEK